MTHNTRGYISFTRIELALNLRLSMPFFGARFFLTDQRMWQQSHTQAWCISAGAFEFDNKARWHIECHSEWRSKWKNESRKSFKGNRCYHADPWSLLCTHSRMYETSQILYLSTKLREASLAWHKRSEKLIWTSSGQLGCWMWSRRQA